jgi:hypothetical protein
VSANQTEPDRVLMYALHFSQRDLHVNRNGYLSEAQKAMMRQWRKRALQEGVLALLLGLPSMALIFSAVRRTNAGFAVPLLLVIGAVTFYIAGQDLAAWARVGADIYSERARSARGRATLWLGPSLLWREPAYHVRLRGITFQVDKQAYRWFDQFERYKIYYAPNSRIILSAEQLAPQLNSASGSAQSPTG